MSRILEFFDRYTGECDWKIIPVYHKTKIPVGDNWNLNYNKGWCRFHVQTRQAISLGILLGAVVDVEGDTPEANARLETILAGHEHPKFQSQKSVHHLFQTPDPGLTCFKHDGVEFRGHKHFSVLPPSVHAGGAEYEWLVEPAGQVPRMPEELIDYYKKHRKRGGLKDGFVSARCSCCGRNEPVHKKRHGLEVQAFARHGQGWDCHRCRRIDVRELCRLIRKNKA